MTKIILDYPNCFPKENNNVPYQVKDMFGGLIKTTLDIHKCFINRVDWELDVNSYYDFIDVHFYKNPRKNCGQGSDEYRENSWVLLKEVLSKLFPNVNQEYSWRWSSYPMYSGYSCDTHQIPGIRMCIPIGTIVTF